MGFREEMMDEVYVSNGNGGWPVDSWQELFSCILKSIVFAAHMKQHGKCTCGCTIMLCEYCLHECW